MPNGSNKCLIHGCERYPLPGSYSAQRCGEHVGVCLDCSERQITEYTGRCLTCHALLLERSATHRKLKIRGDGPRRLRVSRGLSRDTRHRAEERLEFLLEPKTDAA